MTRAITLVHAVKLADRTFFDGLAGIEHAFQNDLAVRRHGKIDALARHHFERLADEGAGDFKLVVPEPQIEAGRQHDRRMIAQRHGDLQPLAARLCGARQDGEMMVRGNADERAAPAEGLQSRDRKVPASRDGVLRNDRACGDVGSGLVLEEGGDRQVGQVGVRHDKLLARCIAGNDARGERALHGIDEPGLQPIRFDAQRPRRLRPRRQVIAGHGHGVPGDVLEHHRAPTIEQRQPGRDLVDWIDSLRDPGQLAGLPRHGEECAHGLPVVRRHAVTPRPTRSSTKIRAVRSPARHCISGPRTRSPSTGGTRLRTRDRSSASRFGTRSRFWTWSACEAATDRTASAESSD